MTEPDDYSAMVPSSRQNLVSLMAGLLSSGLGTVVLIGWTTHSPTLIQVLPGFVPMQFNTALGFLLCGAAILALVYRSNKAAAMCGGLVTLIGLLTGMQYIFHVDLKIDQLFMHHYLTVKTSHPGRMAPTTALGFFLTGGSLFMLQFAPKRRSLCATAAVLGSVILALGLVTFFGYFTGNETPYGWQSLTYMAVHTAGGFSVLGLTVLVRAWHTDVRRSASPPRWLAMPAGAVTLMISVSLWQSFRAHERSTFEQTVMTAANTIRTGIEQQTEKRLLSLVRMAKRWEVRGGTPKEEWGSDARNYLSHQPGYQAIEWADPDFVVRWVVPLTGNEPALGLNLAFEEQRKHSLELSKAEKRLTLSCPIDLVQGEKGFLASVPLYIGNRFDGWLLGVFRADDFFNNVLDDLLAVAPLKYQVSVFDGDERIFTNSLRDEQNRAAETQTEIRLRNVRWLLSIRPNPELTTETQSALPEIGLICGLLVSALVGVVLYFGQTAALRAKFLTLEMTERQQVEEALRTLNETLEQKVCQRTAESENHARRLQDTVEELKRFNQLAIGREQRMIELKQEVNSLAEKLGLTPPYALAFLDHAESAAEMEK